MSPPILTVESSNDELISGALAIVTFAQSCTDSPAVVATMLTLAVLEMAKAQDDPAGALEEQIDFLDDQLEEIEDDEPDEDDGELLPTTREDLAELISKSSECLIRHAIDHSSGHPSIAVVMLTHAVREFAEISGNPYEVLEAQIEYLRDEMKKHAPRIS